MSSDPNALLARLPPAEQAVARLALSRGYVSQPQLLAGLSQLPPGGSVLPLFGGLAPAQLAELRATYEQTQTQETARAHGSDLHNTVAQGSGPIAHGGGPASVGPYVIEKVLARGGMGTVYVAHHPGLKRKVALKLLPAEAGPEEAERFKIEAQAAARLQHPNIVGIHDVGEADGRHYLAMDLIEGQSLKDAVKAGPLPVEEAVRLSEKLARAVAFAHSRSILHRDIKPHNVLVGPDGEPQLTDFGLAKDVSAQESGLTVTGQAMGTPAYMPPEQADGALELIDRRADVYSLGATLYQLLTGEPPFTGETALNIIAKVLSKDARPPSELRAGLHRDLDTLVLRCLEKEPDARYPTAGALADDLARFAAGEPIEARPVGIFERLTRKVRKRPGAVLGGAGLAVALTAALGGGLNYLTSARAELAERERETEQAKAAAEFELRKKAEQAQRELAVANTLREAEIALERGFTALAGARDRDAADQFSVAWSLVQAPKGEPPAEADLLTHDALSGVASRGLHEAASRLRRSAYPPDKKASGVALSPDGATLAVQANDGALRLYPLAGGSPRTLIPPDERRRSRVLHACFTSDGRALIGTAGPGAGGEGTTAVLAIDSRTGEVRWKRPCQTESRVTLSLDGALAATYSRSGGQVQVVTVAEGAPVFACDPTQRPRASYSSGAASVAFTPGGGLIAVGYEDGVVALWDLNQAARPKPMAELTLHSGVVIFLGFFDRGPGQPLTLVSASGRGEVVRWTVTDRLQKEWTVLPSGEVEGITSGDLRATGPAQARLAMGTSEGKVLLWTLQDQRTIRVASFTAHQRPVERCSLSADASGLGTAAQEEPAAHWDLSGSQQWSGRGPVAFSPDGQRLAYLELAWDGRNFPQGKGRHRVRLVIADLRGHPLDSLDLGYERPWALEFLDASTLLFTDDPTHAELAPPSEDPQRAAQFRVRRYSLEDREVVWSEPQPLAYSLKLSPDRQQVLAAPWVYATRAAPPMVLRRVDDGAVVRELRWHGNTITRGLFLPGGELLTASEDGTVARWPAAGEAPEWAVRVLDGEAQSVRRPLGWQDSSVQNRQGVTDVTLSDDGATFVTSDRTGHLRVFRTADGSPVHDLRTPSVSASAPVFCAYASPSTLVAAYLDGRVRLFDMILGRVLRETSAGSRIEFAALSPDRTRLAVTTADGDVRLWKIAAPPFPELATYATDRAKRYLERRTQRGR